MMRFSGLSKRFLIISMAAAVVFPAWIMTSKADESEHITSLKVTRDYEPMIGTVNPASFELNMADNRFQAQVEPQFDPQNVRPEQNLDYKIYLSAAEGYDFHGLKDYACKANFDHSIDLELSEDRKRAILRLTAGAPTVILPEAGNLVWQDGGVAAWDPVAGASIYEVDLCRIGNDGKPSRALCTKESDTGFCDFSEELYQAPGDYIFSVTAFPAEGSCFRKSGEAVLDLEGSVLISDETIGYHTGYWSQKKGAVYYRTGQDMLRDGIYRINGFSYCFEKTGERFTGWKQIGDTWYYFSPEDGKMFTGWQTVGDEVYYFEPGSGRMQRGWQKIGDEWYYLSDNGVRRTGWQKVDGRYYYFKKTGAMNLKPVMISDIGTRYIFDPEDGFLIEKKKFVDRLR